MTPVTASPPRCQHCHYDLRGAPPGRDRCPECGRTQTPPPAGDVAGWLVLVAFHVAMTIAVFGLLMTTLHSSRCGCGRTTTLNMYFILSAMSGYAADHDGRYPTNPTDLIIQDYLTTYEFWDFEAQTDPNINGLHIDWFDETETTRSVLRSGTPAAHFISMGHFMMSRPVTERADPAFVMLWTPHVRDGAVYVGFEDGTRRLVPRQSWDDMWNADAVARRRRGLPVPPTPPWPGGDG